MRTIGAKAIAQRTGNTMRTIQHWITEGVLVPLAETASPGRGATRQFCDEGPHRELVWALIATALANDEYGGSSLANIKRLISLCRREYAGQGDKSPFAEAMKDIVFLVYAGEPDCDSWSITDYNFSDAVRQPAAIAEKLVGSEKQRAVGLRALPIFEFIFPLDRPPHHSAHVLNLTEVLRPLRAGA